MGICGSCANDTDDEFTVQSSSKLNAQQSAKAEADFKLTIKNTVLLILTRLVTALEYEKESFTEVAQRAGKEDFMDLGEFGPLEQWVQDSFDMDVIPALEQDDLELQNDFLQVCQRAMQAEFSQNLPDTQTWISKLQQAALHTQKSLRDATQYSESSDLKVHLFFFAGCFDVVMGSIYRTPQLLYNQIDDLLTQPPR